jgi:hypothetical protein
VMAVMSKRGVEAQNAFARLKAEARLARLGPKFAERTHCRARFRWWSWVPRKLSKPSLESLSHLA